MCILHKWVYNRKWARTCSKCNIHQVQGYYMNKSYPQIFVDYPLKWLNRSCYDFGVWMKTIDDYMARIQSNQSKCEFHGGKQ